MTDWTEYAKFGGLRAVIDPADKAGHKNRYINLLHHKVLKKAFGDDLRDMEILDLGCGTGRFTRLLQKHWAMVTGVDSCQEMLDQNVVEFKECAPVTKLPFPDQVFDAVLSVWTLQYLNDDDLKQAVSEISRVLAKNASIYLIEQVSEKGYDSVFPRTNVDYYRAFIRFQQVQSRAIMQSDDHLIDVVRRGIVPERAFPLLADIHLGLTRNEKMKNNEYTDYFFEFRRKER